MATLTTIVRGSVADGWISDSQTQPYFDNSPGLSGYLYRAAINYAAGVGAGVDYQVVVKCYFASGVNGTESLNGETIAKVYLDGHCQADFDDVRFALKGSETAYVYKRTSKTDSDNAVFIVKVGATLDSNQIVYCYYGNALAVDASSDNALVDVIGGVVGAWAMDEANAVDPVVDYSGNGNDGTPTGTTIVNSKFTGKKARDFDGASYIDCTNSTDFDITQGTVVAYAKTASAVTAAICGKGFDNVNISYNLQNNGGSIRFQWFDGGWHQSNSTVMNDGNWHMVAGLNDGTNLNSWLDTTEQTSLNGGVFPVTDRKLIIGGLIWDVAVSSKFTGSIGPVFITTSLLSDASLGFLVSNYPDVSLVAGSVLVRKWATTTLPTVGSVNSVEKRDFNLAYKINQVTSPAQAAGKDYWVATAHDGNNDVAVIVTEV